MKTATQITARKNSFGHVEYVFKGVGYGSYETAARMADFSKRYERRMKMRDLSEDKLRSSFASKGYTVKNISGQEWGVLNNHTFAKIYVFPKENAHIAKYSIEWFFGSYDEFIFDNAVSYED